MNYPFTIGDLCNALIDRFPAKDSGTVVTADDLAIDLRARPIEICNMLGRDGEQIEATMFDMGICARVKPARVILWELEK